jgi:ankyrin repeat protein
LRCLVEDFGVDVNLVFDHLEEPNLTALKLAAGVGNLAQMRFLVELGADVNQEDSEDVNPLLSAAIRGALDVVRLLLKLRTNVDRKNKDGATALMLVSFAKHEDVVKWLVKAGADTQHTMTILRSIHFEEVAALSASIAGGASAEQTAYLEAKTHCSSPGCDGAGLKKCPACKQAGYCGKPCQYAHWKAHKADCKRWSAERTASKIMGFKR